MKTKTFSPKLSQEELIILKYLFADATSGWGEPLKDIYDRFADADIEPSRDPDDTLKAMHKKIVQWTIP